MVSSITGLSVKEYTLFWIVSHPLQHLVNDWPKVTAQQFTFPKFPQGLTTTMIKDSGVFLMPNLKQSFNISPPPPRAFLRPSRYQGTLDNFKSEGGTFLHFPKFFDHSTPSCWAPYGITSSLHSDKRVKSNKGDPNSMDFPGWFRACPSSPDELSQSWG